MSSKDGFVKNSPATGGTRRAKTEEHSQVRRNDEVEAQRCRWTFYETINL